MKLKIISLALLSSIVSMNTIAMQDSENPRLKALLAKRAVVQQAPVVQLIDEAGLKALRDSEAALKASEADQKRKVADLTDEILPLRKFKADNEPVIANLKRENDAFKTLIADQFNLFDLLLSRDTKESALHAIAYLQNFIKPALSQIDPHNKILEFPAQLNAVLERGLSVTYQNPADNTKDKQFECDANILHSIAELSELFSRSTVQEELKLVVIVGAMDRALYSFLEPIVLHTGMIDKDGLIVGGATNSLALLDLLSGEGAKIKLQTKNNKNKLITLKIPAGN